ncbi:unnamed protein product [Peniophora sp. CBMAI 1063]|nr:unnamed protein product [Peniophora sp. CBMAI 1063]
MADDPSSPAEAPLVVRRRRPRTKPTTPYVRNKTGPKKPTYKTSAQPVKASRENLTLGDWITVRDFVDANPGMTQPAVVAHFRERAEGKLIFSQSALSRNMNAEGRAALEARRTSTANALSMKRARVVTRPDVEHALWLWQQSMEARGETPNGPMLEAKRARFEQLFDVPQEERMTSNGWLKNFTNAYGLKTLRRHGEAGSVDLEAVAKERARLAPIIAQYDPKDTLNFDESGLFTFAVPDRGFATKKMSGKKQNKKRITIGFLVSRAGDRYEPFFINNAKSPRCFKKKKPTALGLLYRSNKKAWMTSALFDEYIRDLDVDFRRQNRHVLLLLDNFSGHTIAYKPSNIRLEFFEPNMTSFVQPLDAGAIRGFKGNYRLMQCLRAVELDEAGEEDLFKMDVLEAMLLAKKAWSKVTAETVQNCWRHTGIAGPIPASNPSEPTSSPSPSSPCALDNSTAAPSTTTSDRHTQAWALVREFAEPACSWSLPDVMSRVETILGADYRAADWQSAFDLACEGEGGLETTLAALDAEETKRRGLSTRAASRTQQEAPARYAPSRDRDATDAQLRGVLDDLHNRNRLHGQPIALEDFLEDEDEKEIGGDPRIPSDDLGIVEAAKKAVAVGQAGHPVLPECGNEESDEEDELAGDGDDTAEPSFSDLHGMCAALEKISLTYAGAGDLDVLAFQAQLRKLRSQLRKSQEETLKQTSLMSYFK